MPAVKLRIQKLPLPKVCISGVIAVMDSTSLRTDLEHGTCSIRTVLKHLVTDNDAHTHV